MKLTDSEIKAAKPKEKPFSLPDGHGLVLLVQPSGAKWWRYRYRFNGTARMLSISDQAIAALEEIRKLAADDVLLFPSERRDGKTMSNNTIIYALYRMGYHSRMTGHGFRGIASTILHEQGFNHDHIELQLAHTQRDAVSAAYNHALYLEPRARMMQEWADYLDKLKAGAEVLPFKAA